MSESHQVYRLRDDTFNWEFELDGRDAPYNFGVDSLFSPQYCVRDRNNKIQFWWQQFELTPDIEHRCWYHDQVWFHYKLFSTGKEMLIFRGCPVVPETFIPHKINNTNPLVEYGSGIFWSYTIESDIDAQKIRILWRQELYQKESPISSAPDWFKRYIEKRWEKILTWLRYIKECKHKGTQPITSRIRNGLDPKPNQKQVFKSKHQAIIIAA